MVTIIALGLSLTNSIHELMEGLVLNLDAVAFLGESLTIDIGSELYECLDSFLLATVVFGREIAVDTALFVAESGGKMMELFPYQRLGISKYSQSGREYELKKLQIPAEKHLQGLICQSIRDAL